MEFVCVLNSYTMDTELQRLLTIDELTTDATHINDIPHLSLEHTHEIQQSIVDYYQSNTEIQTQSFQIRQQSGHSTVTESLFTTLDTTNPVITNLERTSHKFSNYSTKLAETVGISPSAHNGETAYLAYRDGESVVGKTDYYSETVASRVLQFEALAVARGLQESYPVRDAVLQSPRDFKYPKRPMSASAGAALLCLTDDGWRLLLGVRSNDISINPGMTSIVPNGWIDYQDYARGVHAGMRREFGEELFSGDVQAGEHFLNENCVINRVCTGWNAREGGMIFGYGAIIPSVNAYETLRSKTVNSEMTNLIEVDIFDGASVSQVLSLENASGGSLAVAYHALNAFDTSEQYPELPYDIIIAE